MTATSATGSRLVTRGADVLWDVVEEHLDEGAFLLEQWLNAARSTRFTLLELRQTIEHRLLAHVEGLAIGGRVVADKVLWPSLIDEDEATAVEGRAVAALALLMDGTQDTTDRLLKTLLATQNPRVRGGIRLALQLEPTGSLDTAVTQTLYTTDVAEAQAALLEVMAARRLDPGPILATLLAHQNPAVMEPALRAAASGDRANRHFVEDALSHRAPPVRSAAMRVGLLWNLESAWRVCVSMAGQGRPEAMLALASCGGVEDMEVLSAMLRRREHVAGALWALGFSGRGAAVDECLPFLAAPEPPLARLAGEAIVAVTGIPLHDAAFAAEDKGVPADEAELPPLQEDLARDLRPTPVDDLPLADPAKVANEWAKRRLQFSADRRYLLGVALSPAVMESALCTGPLRRTAVLALEIGVRSAGRVQVPALRLGLPSPTVPTDVQLHRPPRWW